MTEQLRETRTRWAKANLRGTPDPIVSSSYGLCSLQRTRPTTRWKVVRSWPDQPDRRHPLCCQRQCYKLHLDSSRWILNSCSARPFLHAPVVHASCNRTYHDHNVVKILLFQFSEFLQLSCPRSSRPWFPRQRKVGRLRRTVRLPTTAWPVNSVCTCTMPNDPTL